MGAVPKVPAKRHILMEAETMEMLGAAPLGEWDKINTGTPFSLQLQQGTIFNAISPPMLGKKGSIVTVLAPLAKTVAVPRSFL